MPDRGLGVQWPPFLKAKWKSQFKSIQNVCTELEVECTLETD